MLYSARRHSAAVAAKLYASAARLRESMMNCLVPRYPKSSASIQMYSIAKAPIKEDFGLKILAQSCLVMVLVLTVQSLSEFV